MKVPILDLAQDVNEFGEEYVSAIRDVIYSTHYINGPEVVAFEKASADFLGAKYTVAVNSGTDALTFALKAGGVGPGDEVITTSFTFFATVESIEQVGAKPVFVDIDPDTYNIDLNKLVSHINKKTRAVVPVHLFGQSCDLDKLLDIVRSRDLLLFEDVAQAFGGRFKGRMLGTFGTAAAYSFFPSKNLGAFGDAGLMSTDSKEIAETALMLRQHGAKQKYHNEILGYNSRLDTLQAAVLLKKLPRVPFYNQSRQEVATFYQEALGDIPGLEVPKIQHGCEHVFHQYSVRVYDHRRDALAQDLQLKGIQTMVYYPKPIHLLPYYIDQGWHLPETETLALQILSLPMWPHMPLATREYVVTQVKDFFSK